MDKEWGGLTFVVPKIRKVTNGTKVCCPLRYVIGEGKC